jgi:hypothetical protein
MQELLKRVKVLERQQNKKAAAVYSKMFASKPATAAPSAADKENGGQEVAAAEVNAAA